MNDRLYPHDDFEATIRIYGPEEGGRTLPPGNGIRWDFAYAADAPAVELYMIVPDFFREDGRSSPQDQPLTVGVELPARMMILADEMREKLHRGRIAPGIRFYCHEGSRRVAEGTVTRITGLFDVRPPRATSFQ
jgi:hypothetical protein